MTSIKSQRGQALVIIALAAVVLFGFAALAIDSSRVYSDKRHAQNAADTSALAAALAKIRKQDYIAAGLSRAADNGYTNDTDSTVTVSLCDATCPALPAGADPSEYIRVRITSVVPMTLGRIVGWTSMTNDVDAIARATGKEPNKLFNPGSALVAVNPNPVDDCFKIMGNTGLQLHDTGIFVNCNGASALFLNGNATISMDANALVAGCANDINFEIGLGEIQCNVAQQPATEATFAGYPTKDATPACAGQGRQNGPSMEPGTFPGTVVLQPNTTFAPGTYCFLADLFIQTNVNFSGTGSVQWVLSKNVSINSTANFDSLEVFTNGVDFKMSSQTHLTTNRFRFFGSGASDFVITGGGYFSSGDVYLYSEAGNIEIDAQSETHLTAPVAPDTYDGLLMHYPWSNTNAFELNGGTNSTWTGQILMPHSEVTYNGGNTFELHGQVIAWEIKINGGADGDIYFQSTTNNPDNNDQFIELPE